MLVHSWTCLDFSRPCIEHRWSKWHRHWCLVLSELPRFIARLVTNGKVQIYTRDDFIAHLREKEQSDKYIDNSKRIRSSPEKLRQGTYDGRLRIPCSSNWTGTWIAPHIKYNAIPVQNNHFVAHLRGGRDKVYIWECICMPSLFNESWYDTYWWSMDSSLGGRGLLRTGTNVASHIKNGEILIQKL